MTARAWTTSEIDHLETLEDQRLELNLQLHGTYVSILEIVQNGLCGACLRPRSDLVLDHDHRSGLVRGLLCRSCNALEGKASTAPHIAAYRAQPPAGRWAWPFVPARDHLDVTLRDEDPAARFGRHAQDFIDTGD